MNKSLKISVIIPVKNCEKDLEKCLKSILFQTCKNLEVICLDEGSNDNSTKILKKSAKEDKRIITVTLQDQNSAAALNKGIKLASGDYISIINPKGWVSLTLYKTFAKTIEKLGHEIDIFVFNSFSKKLFEDNLSVTNKIFRKDFLISNNLFFNEDLEFKEIYFNIQAHVKADLIETNKENFYNTFSKKNDKAETITYKNIFDIFEIISHIETLLKENNLYESKKYEFLAYKLETFKKIFMLTNLTSKAKFYKYMKKSLIKPDDFEEKTLLKLPCYDIYKTVKTKGWMSFWLNYKYFE